LGARERPERPHRLTVVTVELLPQTLGTQPGERVLETHRAAQAKHVLRGVAALEALPPVVENPLALERFRFARDAVLDFLVLGCCAVFSRGHANLGYPFVIPSAARNRQVNCRSFSCASG